MSQPLDEIRLRKIVEGRLVGFGHGTRELKFLRAQRTRADDGASIEIAIEGYSDGGLKLVVNDFTLNDDVLLRARIDYYVQEILSGRMPPGTVEVV